MFQSPPTSHGQLELNMIPSGYVNSLLWEMALDMVDVPIENDDFL